MIAVPAAGQAPDEPFPHRTFRAGSGAESSPEKQQENLVFPRAAAIPFSRGRIAS
jgi:hypothetical protein